MNSKILAMVGLLGVLVANQVLGETPYTIETIDVPGAFGWGINDRGQISGIDANGPSGLVVQRDSWTTFDVPEAYYTYAYGINNRGQVAGAYQYTAGPNGLVGISGFVKTDNAFSTFDVPGATYTYAYGINNRGQTVGSYVLAGRQRGFVKDSDSFTSIDIPGKFVAYTFVQDINDRGQVTGYYYNTCCIPGTPDGTAGWHSFIQVGSAISFLDVPGASDTVANGINNTGQVTGYYYRDGIHGFVWTGDEFITIEIPGATAVYGHGINERGVVVGTYTDGQGNTHTFVATLHPTGNAN